CRAGTVRPLPAGTPSSDRVALGAGRPFLGSRSAGGRRPVSAARPGGDPVAPRGRRPLPRRRSAHAAGLSMLPGLHFPVSVALESMGTGPFLPFGPDLDADPAPAAGPRGGAGVPAGLLPVGFEI